MYKINPNAKASYAYVGEEKTPVYVIDDLLEDLTECRRYAVEEATFSPPKKSAYPGKLAALPANYVDVIMPLAKQAIQNLYGIPKEIPASIEASIYSIVTLNEDDLTINQAVPHFDSLSSGHFAIMHYLNEGDFNGTGFYKHRPTGFENIRHDRIATFDKSVTHFFNHVEAPIQAYFTLSDNHFELIGNIPYKTNRLVIYPGTLLHSGMIDPNIDVVDNVASGRLTANIFVDFQ